MAGSRCFHKTEISGGISKINQFEGQQHGSGDYTEAFLGSMLSSKAVNRTTLNHPTWKFFLSITQLTPWQLSLLRSPDGWKVLSETGCCMFLALIIHADGESPSKPHPIWLKIKS